MCRIALRTISQRNIYKTEWDYTLLSTKKKKEKETIRNKTKQNKKLHSSSKELNPVG